MKCVHIITQTSSIEKEKDSGNKREVKKRMDGCDAHTKSFNSAGTLATLSTEPNTLATDAKIGSVTIAIVVLLSSSACTTRITPGCRNRIICAASCLNKSRNASSTALQFFWFLLISSSRIFFNSFPPESHSFLHSALQAFSSRLLPKPKFFHSALQVFLQSFFQNLQFAFSSSLGFSSRASSKTNSFEFSSSSRFSSRLFQNLQFCIQLFFKLSFKALFKPLQKLSIPTTHLMIPQTSQETDLQQQQQSLSPSLKTGHHPHTLGTEAASSNQALSLSPPPNSRISRIDASTSAASSFLLECRTSFLIGISRNRCTNPPTPQSKLTLKHHCGLGFQTRLSCPAPTHRPGNCAAGWLCSGAFQSRASTPGLVLRNPPALQAHNPAALWVLSPRALCCAPSSRSQLLQSQVLV